MEFHISRLSRDKFQFDETLFALDGNVLFADLYAVRLFAGKINQQRDLARFPEQAARAGQINALGLMDECLRQEPEYLEAQLFRGHGRPGRRKAVRPLAKPEAAEPVGLEALDHLQIDQPTEPALREFDVTKPQACNLGRRKIPVGREISQHEVVPGPEAGLVPRRNHLSPAKL